MTFWRGVGAQGQSTQERNITNPVQHKNYGAGGANPWLPPGYISLQILGAPAHYTEANGRTAHGTGGSTCAVPHRVDGHKHAKEWQNGPCSIRTLRNPYPRDDGTT